MRKATTLDCVPPDTRFGEFATVKHRRPARETRALPAQTAGADPRCGHRCAGKRVRPAAPASDAGPRNAAQRESASAPLAPPGSPLQPSATSRPWPRPFCPSQHRPATVGSSARSSQDRRALPRSRALAHSLGQTGAHAGSVRVILPGRNGRHRRAIVSAHAATKATSASRRIPRARAFREPERALRPCGKMNRSPRFSGRTGRESRW